MRSAASATGVRFSIAVRSRAVARRSPASAPSASSRPLAAGSGPCSPTLVARIGVGAQIIGDLADRRAGPEYLRDAVLLERRDVVVGDDAAGGGEVALPTLVTHDLGEPRPVERVGG